MSNNYNNQEVSTRILQELMTIRTEVSQINQRVRNLEVQFSQQFAPLDVHSRNNEDSHDDAGSAAPTAFREDTEARARLTAAPNRRGLREIGHNPASQSGASLRQRYDAMLQKLHELKNSRNSSPLSRSMLKAQRDKMHNAALDILPSFQVLAPNTTKWNQLDNNYKLFFSLLLEEKIFVECQLELFRCKDQWSARRLLSEAYKALRQQVARAETRRRRDEEQEVENLNIGPMVSRDA